MAMATKPTPSLSSTGLASWLVKQAHGSAPRVSPMWSQTACEGTGGIFCSMCSPCKPAISFYFILKKLKILLKKGEKIAGSSAQFTTGRVQAIFLLQVAQNSACWPTSRADLWVGQAKTSWLDPLPWLRYRYRTELDLGATSMLIEIWSTNNSKTSDACEQKSKVR